MPALHPAAARAPLGVLSLGSRVALGTVALGTVALGTATLVACAAAPRAVTVTPPRIASYVFTCDDASRFAVRYDRVPEGAAGRAPAATLRFPNVTGDREVRVAADTAANGARYRGHDTAGDVTFWEHQGEATLTMTAAPTRTCRAQEAATAWDEARLLGATYRAVGKEPGWTLEVDGGRRLSFVGDYGNTRVATPAPPPATESTAASGGAPGVNRVSYTARTDAHALAVEILRQPCRDATSGERYPTTAVVRLDGREYRGCGRWLGAEPRG